jgi:hypothetical protein
MKKTVVKVAALKFNPRLIRVAEHRDDIEAIGFVGDLHQLPVPASSARDAPPLRQIHVALRWRHYIRLSSLHFDKTKRFPIVGNDIDLAKHFPGVASSTERNMNIPRYNAIAEPANKVIARGGLGKMTQLDVSRARTQGPFFCEGFEESKHADSWMFGRMVNRYSPRILARMGILVKFESAKLHWFIVTRNDY